MAREQEEKGWMAQEKREDGKILKKRPLIFETAFKNCFFVSKLPFYLQKFPTFKALHTPGGGATGGTGAGGEGPEGAGAAGG